MTEKEQFLIQLMTDFKLNQENIPVELIRAYSLFRRELNTIRHSPPPVFTENNIPIDMKYWDDFQFTGLNRWDFIACEFYKYGFDTEDCISDLRKMDE